ncbi:hypothetical protein [Paenibacillus macquariensis]|uniref:MFS transporter, DHA2 family, multidrug resistance protein n=1 Tax=Paenibacillus macquariensis TaxID=948756 RepID=A0ABY1JVN4_9BACL|nr:hypothetical protein [Paenibacillus macquariensis]MEC0090769.1 hypothetical protein [Paenibacillus macquariensis]OAB34512.1 hypothetical protein PMSM_11635 [Paenibacillus macquariensis subsp. macquariensis]SIQ84249.1 MFS transporter, DHA2 family, multidrug resistance protein [Paenibacillus macquariensis]
MRRIRRRGSFCCFIELSLPVSHTLPEGLGVSPIVRDSLDEALIVVENLPATAGAILIEMAQTAFDKSFVVVLATATIILFVAAFMVRAITNRTKALDNKD